METRVLLRSPLTVPEHLVSHSLQQLSINLSIVHSLTVLRQMAMAARSVLKVQAAVMHPSSESLAVHSQAAIVSRHRVLLRMSEEERCIAATHTHSSTLDATSLHAP